MAMRQSVEYGLSVCIVRTRGRRSINGGLKNGVKVRGEIVAAGVDVDGGLECLDVKGFLDTPLDPVMLRCEDKNVFFAEVVAVLTSELEHGRFEFTKSIGGGGFMLLESAQRTTVQLPLKMFMMIYYDWQKSKINWENCHPPKL